LVAGAVEHPASAARLTSFCETPEEAAEVLIAGSVPGDVVLVKGSRGVRMEIVVEKLKAAFGSAKI
jgi:UDP-N-acetylmuramyl pentapeptide synthase